MEINFNTENLIVTHAPGKAGGKFINMVLALHPSILFQNEKLAKSKMDGIWDIERSYRNAYWTFEEKLRTGYHEEYGCNDLAGFNMYDIQEDIKADEKKCNELWIELTNQEKFYFFMVDQWDGMIFNRYRNRKTIRLKNYSWIVQARGASNQYMPKQEDLDNMVYVDMSLIKDQTAFNKEIRSLFEFIGLSQPNQKQVFDQSLENLRKGFLETFTIGFTKKRRN